MRRLTHVLAGLLATTAMQSIFAIEPEQVTLETLGQPQATWVVSHDVFGPRYVLDVASGEMVGMISTPAFTPALVDDPKRQEIYAAESYFTRGTRGERNDVLSIYDYENFAVIEAFDPRIDQSLIYASIKAHAAGDGFGARQQSRADFLDEFRRHHGGHAIGVAMRV